MLEKDPGRLNNEYLAQFESFRDFTSRIGRKDHEKTESSNGIVGDGATPEELLETTFRSLRDEVAADLLERIKGASPQFFERLVVQLLVTMGYGGTFAEAAKVIRATGDGGIDGVIKEDRLGLDAIYVQAKRWEAQVGRPEIQKFAGSLDGERARKGVFITTSRFTPDALAYVQRIDKRIVLIDGGTLADLMIEHGVAVTTAREYIIPRIDLDFFDEG